MREALSIEEDPEGRGWVEAAACRGISTDLFFDATPGSQSPQVRAVCARCPVIVQCLEWAMRTEEGLHVQSRHGVFGGQTPSGRAKLQRERNRAAARGQTVELTEDTIRSLARATRSSPGASRELQAPPAVGSRWRTRDERDGDRVVLVSEVEVDQVYVQRVLTVSGEDTVQKLRTRMSLSHFAKTFKPDDTQGDPS